VWRERVEVVHVCNPPDLFFGLTALFRLSGTAVVFDQHDSWPELFAAHGNGPLLAGIAALCTRASLAVAHKTLVTSDGAITAALSRGADPKAIVVVRNGVDLERLPLPAPDDGRLVGYLGNMNPQDGLTELLEMIRCIRYDHGRADVKFVLVGDGTSLTSVRQRIRALGLEPLVTLTGRLPPREAWAMLTRCAVCVQPDPPNAFTHISTMVKSLEYMALGKPIVAFGLVETRRVCGDAALYASEASPRSLASCVLALLDDDRLRTELGDRGRRRVERSFAWARSETALLEAYALLPLNRRGCAR
jgi:glycosyltransferase involved in cell wall biosynthesis